MINKRYVEISVNEYRELLEKGVRLEIVIQKLKDDEYASNKTILFLAEGPQNKEEQEEE